MSWYTADSTPSGTASTSISTSDISASFIVGHRRDMSSVTTGLPSANDVPKSPLRQFPSQRKYCVRKGSFRPISSRWIATCSSSGISPWARYMFRTGSPGEM